MITGAALAAFEFPPASLAILIASLGALACAAALLMLSYRNSARRRRTKEELEISEQRSEMPADGLNIGVWELANGLSIGVWDWNLATDKQYWSPRMKEIVGITNQDYAPSYSETLPYLHPDDSERVLAMLEAHLQKRGPYDIECRIHRKDGRYAWVHLSGQAIWDENRKPVRMIGLLDDITERKRAEARLRAVVDYAIDGLITIDERGNVESFNPACERIFGYPSAEVIGRNIRMLMPEPYQSEHDGYLSRYAATGESRIIGTAGREVSGRRKDGSVFPMDLSVCAFQLEDGRHYSGTVRDITERKRVDETRARLTAIVESSEDAIIGKDLHGIVTDWNKGAEIIFGYTDEEMIGQPISRIIPPGHEHEEVGLLDRIRHGEKVVQWETVRQRKDGRLIQVSLALTPIRDDKNVVVGAAKIARDITERKLLERQLRQSQKMEAIGQMTGGVAHDFNNLLAVIVGNLDLLESMLSENAAALKRIQTAQKAAARGADLTRRMLAFSSREDLTPAPLQIEESIQNTIELAGRALGPEIKVVTHFDPSVPAVFADAARLENALLNLAVNARDAMPKGGTLTIATHISDLEEDYPPVQTGEMQPGRYVCVSVTDTGEGMSAETLERAFDPFFTTKPRGKGTGLGLAMVYGFAKQSGGAARLYSEQGYGTTVSLYLPLADALSKAAPAPAVAVSSARQGGTVLVVDDEPDLLEIANANLVDLGYKVLQAENGAAALAAVMECAGVDLMITDVVMPGGMNGIELAQRVRAVSPQTRIIFTSGFPADALEERNGPLVDGPLLHKPYQRAELVAMVRRTMELAAPGQAAKVEAGQSRSA